LCGLLAVIEVDHEAFVPLFAAHICSHAFDDADVWELVEISKPQAVGVETTSEVHRASLENLLFADVD